MRNTRIYFIRHAQADRRIGGGARPLTIKGLLDAAGLVNVFKGIELDHIYSSPYTRAVDTVTPLAIERSLKIKIRYDLRERTGYRDDSIVDQGEYLKALWNNYPFKNGESLEDVRKRNIGVVRDILKECKGPAVAAGTHSIALSAILNHFDKSFDYDFFMRLLPRTPYVIRCDFADGEYAGSVEL